jgi:hypothetical protein
LLTWASHALRVSRRQAGGRRNLHFSIVYPQHRLGQRLIPQFNAQRRGAPQPPKAAREGARLWSQGAGNTPGKRSPVHPISATATWGRPHGSRSWSTCIGSAAAVVISTARFRKAKSSPPQPTLLRPAALLATPIRDGNPLGPALGGSRCLSLRERRPAKHMLTTKFVLL